MDKSMADAQLERLRGAPPLVLWLTQNAGAWVVGSRADFWNDRIKPDSDWDILIEPHRWEDIVGALPMDRVVPTRRGGWRITPKGDEPVIDLISMRLATWATIPVTYAAWHPASGTLLRKEELK